MTTCHKYLSSNICKKAVNQYIIIALNNKQTMSLPKKTAKIQIPQQKKTYTLKLTKKQANYIKAVLPLRYSIQLHTQRKDRNSPKPCLQSKKNSKSKGKCKTDPRLKSPDTSEPKQKKCQNAKDIQVEEIKLAQYLTTVKQKNVHLSDQDQVTFLKDSIMKFFEAMPKSFQKEKELQNCISKIKYNFNDNIYRNFIQFQREIKTLVDKIISENPKEKIQKKFKKILDKIQLYSKQPSIKKKQQKSRLQNKQQLTQKNVEPTPAKSSKNVKKTIKVTQKQLQLRNVKNKSQKKNVSLPQGLFVVAEQTQSSINSSMQIDSFEAGRINQLLKKLHIIHQQELLKTISQEGRIKSIKHLNCREAENFVEKIKKMLRKTGREQLNEGKELQSSFQVEDQE